MNGDLNEQLDRMKNFKLSANRKKAVRSRLIQSLQNPAVPRSDQRWKGTAFAFITIFICFISLYALLGSWNSKTADNSNLLFSWATDSILSEAKGTETILYSKKDHEQVGILKTIHSNELHDIVQTKAIFMEEELSHFPYPTTMYIEHMKRDGVVQRYHFVVEAGNQKVYITFDHPKAEYAEIFHAISTIKIEGSEPYVHDEPLYVTYGYAFFYYPSNLAPVEITSEREIYTWDGATEEDYYAYLNYLQANVIGWTQVMDGGPEIRYRDQYGNIINIQFNQGKLIYEYVYANS